VLFRSPQNPKTPKPLLLTLSNNKMEKDLDQEVCLLKATQKTIDSESLVSENLSRVRMCRSSTPVGF